MRTKNMLRILSVFLTVVIVSVGFMQPIAYANAAVIGGGVLVIIVASMLMSAGVSFSSVQQAEAVSSHAISSMPPDLLNRIKQIEPPNPMLVTAAIMAGIAYTVKVSYNLYKDFRDWVNEYFNVNEATVAAGQTSISGVELTGNSITVETANGSVTYPIYSSSPKDDASLKGIPAALMTPEYYSYDITPLLGNYVPFHPFTLNGKSYYIQKSSGNPTIGSGDSLPSIMHYFYRDIGGSKTNLINDWRCNTDRPYYFYFYATGSSLSMNILSLARNGSTCLVWRMRTVVNFDASIILPATNNNLPLNADAYANEIPTDQENVQFAIPATVDGLMDLDWRKILDEYLLDTWDFQATLDQMREQIEAQKDVIGQMGLDAMADIATGLQLELDRLKRLIEEEGADVIGGVEALNDELYDAGLVIAGLGALAAADSARIAEFERDLAAAKEKIKELVDEKEAEKDIDVPVNPPVEIPETQVGKINWSILMGIAVFDKFPFCLPKDVYSFFSMLAAPPKEPVFVFDIFNGKFGDDAVIVLDFKRFDDIRKLVRSGSFILLVVGLMGVTKKYIWSGGG